MRITVINGCLPEDSFFTQLGEYEKTLREAPDASIEIFHLAHCGVKQCIGCNSCAFRTPGECVHKDDVMNILKSVVRSDRTVFIYSMRRGFMNSLMKKFIDRLYLLELPYLEIKNGEMRHKLRYDVFPACGFIVHPDTDTTEEEMDIAKKLNAHIPDYYQGTLLFNHDTGKEIKELVYETIGC